MNLFRKIPWQCDDKNYEIWLLYDDQKITVAAFLNNHPANGFRYQVQIPKRCDAKSLLEKHPVPELVESCKRDIAENRWEKLKKCILEASLTKI